VGNYLHKIHEGDFIETYQNLIFDVKGLIHPPNRIIAFIRYFQAEKGERKRQRKTYSKVYSLSERYVWLKKNFPEYLVYDPVFDEVLCEVPVEDVKRHYKPAEELNRLRKAESLDDLEFKALELASLLKSSANVSWNSIGVSGSIMVGLHTSSSDIDLVVYGSENCRKVYSVIKDLLRDSSCSLKPYSMDKLRRLFDFRSKDTLMNFEDFAKVESRKILQGMFMGTDYYIRFVKEWNEIEEKYGDVHYKNVGYGKIETTVADDSESIFTPCTYKIENARVVEGPKIKPIREIVSFRGRFCEQAKRGEKIVAQGKIELVVKKDGTNYYRLLIGNKPTDCMVPKFSGNPCRSRKIENSSSTITSNP